MNIQAVSREEPSYTYVRRAYDIFSTVKKCSYVYKAFKLSDPGFLARAAVISFAVPIAEQTGSDTAKKCAYVAAEGLSLIFNPVSWGFGKMFGWCGDKAAELIQNGLKIEHPELQDLVEIVAIECSSLSAQATSHSIHLRRNLAEHQLKRIQIDIKRPEQHGAKKHHKTQHKKEPREPSVDEPSLEEAAFEFVLDSAKKASEEMQRPLKEEPKVIEIAKDWQILNLVMGSSALIGTALLVNKVSVGFVFVFIAASTKFYVTLAKSIKPLPTSTSISFT